MDTEHFVLNRHEILERLQGRRHKDLSAYPFRLGQDYGVKLPSWARLALSFITRDGVLNRFLEVGLPLALPFLMKRQVPSWGRLVKQFFLPKA